MEKPMQDILTRNLTIVMKFIVMGFVGFLLTSLLGFDDLALFIGYTFLAAMPLSIFAALVLAMVEEIST